MEEKLLELIYNYSLTNKIADFEFIHRVVENVVNYMKLDDYVKDVVIDDAAVINGAEAMYNVSGRKVMFSPTSLEVGVLKEEAHEMHPLE